MFHVCALAGRSRGAGTGLYERNNMNEKPNGMWGLGSLWPAAIMRFVLFGLIWAALTDGSASSWAIGLPVVALATLASVRMLPAIPWSWRGVPGFLTFFIWQSLRGGIDVARRALHPRLPITPGTVEYRLRLPPGPSRVFMVNVASLLPGTLSAELDAQRLLVHALDETLPVCEELQALEERVAAVLKCELVDRTPEV